MIKKKKIKSFTDLVAWREGHTLVLMVYKVTEKFPTKEIYCLTNQILRCVISITSNIAEGFSRQSNKEKAQFYYTAKGSLTELQNQLLIAKDVGYLNQESFYKIADQSIKVSRLITGLLKYLKIKPIYTKY